MTNITSNKNFEEIEHSDLEIIKLIWFNPRYVFKYLLNKNYQKWVLLLMILGGIAALLENTSSKDYGDKIPVYGVIIIAIIGGVFFGWIGFYIYSLLLSWTGKWLNGKADSDSLLLVIAYAQIPIAFGIIIYISQLLIFDTSEFSFDQIRNLETNLKLIAILLLGIEIILSAWSLVIGIIGISEVQKFTILKSIINLILPTLVVALPIIICVLILKAI